MSDKGLKTFVYIYRQADCVETLDLYVELKDLNDGFK